MDRDSLEKMIQAVGLATTICPEMQIDAGDPIGMMQKVVDYVRRLEKESARWRAMFEASAHLLFDELEMYGLAGDEATEEIGLWLEACGIDREGQK